MKTQNVRLIDVFFLGPFLVWAAVEAKTLPDWARVTLAVSGVLTTVYNGRNFQRIQDGGKPLP